MHKQYPYLQNGFIYQTDVERQKRNILKEIDSFVNQRQYIKITLLNWDEEPIKEIEGEISSGSISKVGDSPIRRTAQLTCAVDAHSYSVDDGKADFAINKKVFIEIGVKNETPHYPDYPIFWFPEGVFFIGSFSINAGANSATTITLGLKDKMAMLNGDVGGTLPASVVFDSMDTQLPTGEYIEKKVLIYNIIKELVNHYGGEDLNRIVIEGVPLRIRRVMQWIGDTPLYQIATSENYDPQNGSFSEEEGENGEIVYTPQSTDNNNYIYYEYTTEKSTEGTIIKFEKGDDVGYIMDDFVIMDELVGAPGESVTSVLDKIKNILGNYEYFYDVFGIFHFREIKNYYVTTQARTLLDEMVENDYLVETNNSRSIYTFDDEKLLTSITVNPQYENIKNDYIIEGQTTIGDSDIVYPVRYHLAIDNKPLILGRDNRSTVRHMINNNDAIEKAQNELKQLTQTKYNNSMPVEEALYNINRAKANLQAKYDYILANDRDIVNTIASLCNFNYKEEDLLSPNYPYELMCDKLIQMIVDYQPEEPLNYDENISSYENNEYEAFLSRQTEFSKLESFDFQNFMNKMENNLKDFCKQIDFQYLTLNYIVNIKNTVPLLISAIKAYNTNEEYIKNILEELETLPEETDNLEDDSTITINLLDKTNITLITREQYEDIVPDGAKWSLENEEEITKYKQDQSKTYLISSIQNFIEEKEKQKISVNDDNSFIEDTMLKDFVSTETELFKLQVSLLQDSGQDILSLQSQVQIPLDLTLETYVKKWESIYNYLINQKNFLDNNLKQYKDIKKKLLGDSALSEDTSSQEWVVNDYNTLINIKNGNIEQFSDYIDLIEDFTIQKSGIRTLNIQRLKENCKSLWDILDFIYNENNLIRLLDDNNWTINEIWNYLTHEHPEINANSLEDLHNQDKEIVDTYSDFDIEDCLSSLEDINDVTEYWYTYTKNGQFSYKEINEENNESFYQKYQNDINSLVWTFYEEFGKYNQKDKDSINVQIQSKEQEIEKYKNANYTFKLNAENPNLNKPYYGQYPTSEDYQLVIYNHPRNNLMCAAYCQTVTTELPEVGNFNLIYCTKETSEAAAGEYWYWDGQMYQPADVLAIYDNDNQYYAYNWRTKLYLDGLEGVLHGTNKGYYYEELAAFWPQVYDLVEQKFFGEKEERSSWFKALASTGIYYLDFLDAVGTSFGEWSVNNIGRRSDVIVKEDVNCLFQPEIPNVILIPSSGILDFNTWQDTYMGAYQNKDLESTWSLTALRAEAAANYYPWTQVPSEIYNNLITGGYKNAAFDEIKYELYLHTRYQKTVSLTSIPVFYLEPNDRITVNDTITNTYGDFVVQSINLTLGPGANMSISCNETAERF